MLWTVSDGAGLIEVSPIEVKNSIRHTLQTLMPDSTIPRLPFIVESCVETLEQAAFAEKNGADQLELCTALEHDGLTPPEQLIADVLSTVSIPVKVMLRHRPGNFEYNTADIVQLKSDLKRISGLGVSGIVFGAIRNGDLDYDLISLLAGMALIPMTVHKAIDQITDRIGAIKILGEIDGVESVLSSGGRSTALSGASELRKMVETASSRLQIIAAGKITVANRHKVYQLTSAPALHGRKIAGWSDIQHR